MQFSVRTALAAVSSIAVLCAALRFANRHWCNAAWATSVAVLLCAALAAGVLTGQRRAYWFGFSLVGWFYLIVVSANWGNELKDRLPTTWLLDTLVEHMPGIQAPASAGLGGMGGGMGGMGMGGGFALTPAVMASNGYRHDFRVIGQLGWSLILALAGGMIARRLYLSDRSSNDGQR